jgi:hypothetical protein
VKLKDAVYRVSGKRYGTVYRVSGKAGDRLQGFGKARGPFAGFGERTVYRVRGKS